MKANKYIDEWEELDAEVKKHHPNLKNEFDEMDRYLNIISPIVKRRKELGISQRDLARICEMPQSTVARFETNVNKLSVSTLIKVTNALGLTISIH